MYEHPAQPGRGSFDWCDLWQLVSLVGTGLSVVPLFAGGKEGKEFGQLGTVLGVGSTATQWATTPPRCVRCQSRMRRPAQLYQGGPQWVCGWGHALYPAN